MIRKSTMLPFALALAAVILITFGISTVVGGPKSVRGQVVAVEQASVTTISNLTIEDDSGKRWTFIGSGKFSGFTPSHLVEHRALRESITVEYEESDSGELKIVGISD
jgi:hypothetical protein